MSVLKQISQEVETVLDNVSSEEFEQTVSLFSKEKRVFIDGEGRSGFVGKCFGMRLMHLGFTSYIMGETNTPSFRTGDIYVWISGSGTTGSVRLNAENAKKTGATIIGITSKTSSPLADLSEQLIIVPATVRGQSGSERKSIQLLGSLFDQSVHLLVDGICLAISMRDAISNDHATKNHV